MGDYQIKPGDNLWKIVKNELNIKNNAEIQKKVDEIARLNNIKNKNSIFVGQQIKLYDKQEKPDTSPAKKPDRSPCFVFQYEPQTIKGSYPDVYFSSLQRSQASSANLHTIPVDLDKGKIEIPLKADLTTSSRGSSVQENGTVKKAKKVKVSTQSLRNFDITTKFEGSAAEIDKHLGGVLKGQGKKFLELQEKYGINAVFLAAITMNESGNGTSYSARKRNNVGGVRYRNSYRFRTYNNVSECLDDMAYNLKDNYINEGRTTVARIGSKYCPISDKSDKEGINKHWARNVSFYMGKIINDTT